jgi:hypothetical protein
MEMWYIRRSGGVGMVFKNHNFTVSGGQKLEELPKHILRPLSINITDFQM